MGQDENSWRIAVAVKCPIPGRSRPASVFRDFSQPRMDLTTNPRWSLEAWASANIFKTVVERYRPRRLIIFFRDELSNRNGQSFPAGNIPSALLHRRRARPRPFGARSAMSTM
jgi:hypothetical protein